MQGSGKVRDRVLDRAELREGETLLDVGCGDGLIAFGALERGAGRVIFSDVSDDLLDVCRRLAGGDARCEFVSAAAEDLGAIDDGSVDVVTTRSVIIYVAAEAARVRRVLPRPPPARAPLDVRADQPLRRLRRGGRFLGVEMGHLAPLADRLQERYDR